MVASRDGKMYLYPKDYIMSDYGMPCVDTDGNLVVANDTRPHRASHLLIFPFACELPVSDADEGCLPIDVCGHGARRKLASLRACGIPTCEDVMPQYGGRDVRRDGGDDDLHATVGAIAEASYEDDSDDARVCVDRSHYSSGIEEVCIDRRDDYVEVMSTFPCVPVFPSHLAFCAEGIAGRRFITSEQIPELSRAMASSGPHPRARQ
jgi:hypothetical protein